MAPFRYAYTKHRVVVSVYGRRICDINNHTGSDQCDDIAVFTFNDELHTLGDVRKAIARRLGIEPDEFSFEKDFTRPEDESTLLLKYVYADVKDDYVFQNRWKGLPTVLFYIRRNLKYEGGMLDRVLDYAQLRSCASYDKNKGGQLAKRFRTIIAALKAEDAKQALEKQEAV
ncbi:hypothetical protein GGI24_002928 [Coemansia furcata]|nr:hypothetical protein GGI24_002928 [Coemansia furcata]